MSINFANASVRGIDPALPSRLCNPSEQADLRSCKWDIILLGYLYRELTASGHGDGLEMTRRV